MTARRLRRALLACAAVLALAGCVAVPTSGPVAPGDGTVVDAGSIDVLAEGPRPGATPEQVVEGFMLAGGAGFLGEFATAREYLTGPVRQDWQPRAGVIVYSPSVEPEVSQDGHVVTLQVPVVARVDAEGRYVEAPAEAQESVTFELEQASGEWRISSAPQGLILDQSVFDQQFRGTPLYFVSADGEFLVPETRWFPARNLQTSVTRALIAGPSPWLRDAVTTAFPEGVTLTAQTVVLDDQGVAQVNLEPASAVLSADLPELLAQLDQSLLAVPGVRSVKVQTEGVLVDGPATLERGGLPDGPVEMLQADRLMTFDVDELTEVGGIDALPAGSRDPARDEAGDVRVVVDGAGDLVTIPASGEERATLLQGGDLVAPSVDRFGWVWTSRGPGGLIAASTQGDPVAVAADWLDGRTVLSVRMARDGTRLAVVSRGTDGVSVDVCAVVRDASGTPQRTGEPIRAGAVLVEAAEVVWLDEWMLGVIGRSTGATAVHRVPVSGPTTALAEVPDLVSLAGGKVVYAASGDGVLHKLVGNATWVAVAGVEGVRDPAYPG